MHVWWKKESHEKPSRWFRQTTQLMSGDFLFSSQQLTELLTAHSCLTWRQGTSLSLPLPLPLPDFAAGVSTKRGDRGFVSWGWSIPPGERVCAANSRLQLQRKQIIGSGGGVGDKLRSSGRNGGNHRSNTLRFSLGAPTKGLCENEITSHHLEELPT